MPVQYTLFADTRAAGTVDPPGDANTLVRAANALGAGSTILNAAFAGGADPTGAADSTAAISAAVAAALSSGQPVIIPPGTYKTTATLNWKGTGLVVRGPGGPDNTTISCTGTNIPVVQVAGSYQDISGLTLTYSAPQSSGSTAANVITFGDDTAGSCFQGNYHELTLLNGQTGMAISPSIVTVAGMFSCRLENIYINGVSSSFINLNGNNGLGGANCTGCVFSNIYCDFTGGTVAGSPVLMKNWDEFVFHQLNIEHCTVSAQDVLSTSNCANAVFSSLHFEALTTSLNGGSLLHISGAGCTVISGMSARFCVYTGSASNPLIKFFGSGPSTLVISGVNEAGCTVTTPSHPLIDYGSATNCITQITGRTTSQTTVNTVNAGAGDVLQLGIPAVTGVQAVTSGFTAFGTGGLNQCLNNSSGGTTAMVAGTWYYAALYIPFNVTLTGIQVTTGGTGGTDNWIVALWPIAGGAALANSALAGTAAPAANTKKAFPFTAPVAVTGPGVYIIGIQSNGTTAKFLAFSNVTEGFATGSAAGSFGTVPSLSPATTYTANVGPFANTY